MRLVKSVRGSALTTLLIFGLLIFGLAACGESPLAPKAAAPEPPNLLMPDAAPLLARYGGSDNDRDIYKHSRDLSVGSRTFTVKPGDPALKSLGKHLLWIPANAICDPETSSYGTAHWNAPCKPIDRPIKITANWATVQGHAVLQFKPELRFVPAKSREGWVMLWAKAPDGVAPKSSFAVLWRDPETGRWIDESVSDPTLRAQVDRKGWVVSRRLKHFSIYYLWFGFGSYNVTSGMGGMDWGGW